MCLFSLSIKHWCYNTYVAANEGIVSFKNSVKEKEERRENISSRREHIGKESCCVNTFARSMNTPRGLALDDVESEAGERGLLVARLHIEAGLVHGGDDLVERKLVVAGLMHGHA